MPPTSTVNLEERLQQLIRYIGEGRILEAMNEFYSKNISMQENANAPTVGLAANIEREGRFLASVKEWKGAAVKAMAVNGSASFVEWVLDWIAIDGTPVHLEQVAVARWKKGKIVQECFYYDTGGTKS
jgi:hypothetical protein